MKKNILFALFALFVLVGVVSADSAYLDYFEHSIVRNLLITDFYQFEDQSGYIGTGVIACENGRFRLDEIVDVENDSSEIFAKIELNMIETVNYLNGSGEDWFPEGLPVEYTIDGSAYEILAQYKSGDYCKYNVYLPMINR